MATRTLIISTVVFLGVAAVANAADPIIKAPPGFVDHKTGGDKSKDDPRCWVIPKTDTPDGKPWTVCPIEQNKPQSPEPKR